jgi:multimeric flavodoxin WrbA
MKSTEMKILALIGSQRKRGNTARLVELIAAQMQALAAGQDEPFDIDIVYLGDLDIEMCRGCRVCFDRGETHCPCDDDLLAIYEQMHAADGVLLAGPVYVNDVNGVIKNWIDRLAFVCHRPAFFGKSAYLLATVGVGPTSHALKTMRYALSSWGFDVTGQSGFKMGALMDSEALVEQFESRAEKIAAALWTSIRGRQAENPSFLSLMTFRIQQGYWQRDPQKESIDYHYWAEQGWIDPRRSYYIPHRANRLKVELARLAGAILAPFVT